MKKILFLMLLSTGAIAQSVNWNTTPITSTATAADSTFIRQGGLIKRTSIQLFVNGGFPSQTGNSGKALVTNGSTTSWQSVTGITSLNGQTGATQTFTTGTSGNDFTISSLTNIHTFNIPSASSTKRGLLTNSDWTTFNSKYGSGTVVGGSLQGTLPNPSIASSGVTAGSYTNANITVGADGRVTAASNGSGGGGGGSGTVTTVGVTSSNGYSGVVTNPTTTPSITISNTVSGILKGSPPSVGPAIPGTDYQLPITLTTTGSGAATFTSNNLNIPTPTGTVSTLSVATANGLNGSVSNPTTTPTITLGTTLTNGTIPKSNGTGFVPAVAGTDYQQPITLTTTGSGAATLVGNNLNIPTPAGGGSGTVTTVSIASANGFGGSVSNPSTTPNINITTSVTGMTKGSGGALTNAIPGTDYQAPITLTTSGTSGAASLVGNVLNIPQYSGGGGGGSGTVTNVSSSTSDITVSNPTTTPVLTLSSTGVTPGSYTNANITVNSSGRITSASNGTGGGGSVSSVSAGTGMNFTTITSSGPVNIDTNKVAFPNALASNGKLSRVNKHWVYDSTAYENSANKVSDISTDPNSTTKYPNNQALTTALGSSYYDVSWKQPANFATTTALPSYTVSFDKTILTATSNGSLSLSEGPISTNTKILVKDETSTNQPNNGIYVVTNTGSSTSQWVLTRAPDANTGPRLQGAVVMVTAGTTNGQHIFKQMANGISLGSTFITWQDIASTGVSSVSSTTSDLTVTNPSTTPSLTVNSAPKLTTGRTIGMTGDVTWTSPSFDGSANVTNTSTIQSGAVTTTKIANSNVTYAKIQNESPKTILGNPTTSSAAPQEIGTDSTLRFLSSGKLSTSTPSVVISGTSYTPLDSNYGKVHVFTSSSTVTITLSTGVRSNYIFYPYLQGTGKILFTNGGGTTRETVNDTIVTRYSYATAYLRTSTIWTVSGSLGTPASGSAGSVPITRNINTTSPLQGGGALSSDLTLSVLSASGTQSGVSKLYNNVTGNNTDGAPDQNSVNLALAGKQATLVSGTSLKTLGGVSLLGSGDFGILGPQYGGTGIGSYTLGDIMYSNATNSLGKLAGNTSTNKYFLTSTGTGSAANAPVFENFQTAVNNAIISRTTLGSIFNNTGAFSSSNYTQSGTTFTVNSTTISGNSGGSASVYTNKISYNYYTLNENYVIEGSGTLGTVNSTSKGVGIGVDGSSGQFNKYSYMVVYDATNTASAGKLSLTCYDGTTATTFTTLVGIPPATGDAFTFRIIQSKNKLTAEFTNTTQNKVISETWVGGLMYNNASDNFRVPKNFFNIGRFCLWNFGFVGSISVLKVTSTATTNSQIMAVGDSRTRGYYSSSINERWADQVAKDTQLDIVVEAGSGITTADILLAINELKALAPTYCYLLIGVNDIAYSVSNSTIQTNYASIVSQLQGVGITVYPIEELPNGTYNTNVGIFNTWLNSNYTSNVVRANSQFDDGTGQLSTTLSPDGVHFNTIGVYKFASVIERKLPNQYNYRIGSDPIQFKATIGGDAYGRDLSIGTNDAYNLTVKSGANTTIQSGNNTIIQPSTGYRTYIGAYDAGIVGSLNVEGDFAGAGNLGSVYIKNTNAAGVGSARCITSDGALQATLSIYNPSFVTSGIFQANRAILNTTANYLGIGSAASGGTINFYTDGTGTSNVVATIKSTGMGIGTTSPTANLHTISTTEQFRVGYDASNYYSTTVSSTGGVTWDAVGTGSKFVISDNVGIGGTPTAGLHIANGSASQAAFRLGAQTAPTSPNNGDIWYDNSLGRMYARENGNTFPLMGTRRYKKATVSGTATSGTLTTVFTTEANLGQFIITNIYCQPKSVTGSGSGTPVVSFGVTGTAYTDIVFSTSLQPQAINRVHSFAITNGGATNIASIAPSTNVVLQLQTTASGYSVYNFDVYVEGFYEN